MADPGGLNTNLLGIHPLGTNPLDAIPPCTSPADRPADVMVVEDDPGVREALRDVLREEGYDVVAAGSPQDALALLGGRHAPGVALIDVNLGPGISGIALAGRIRLTHPACRILLTSGAELPVGLAFDGFVAKPFSTDQLLAALRSLEANGTGHAARAGGGEMSTERPEHRG